MSRECYDCHGSGVGVVLRDSSTNQGDPQDCPTCDGTGSIA